MRVTWAAILAAITITAGAVLAVTPSRAAAYHAVPYFQVCRQDKTPHACLNLWNGNQTDGAKIVYYQYTQPNLDSDWAVSELGTVIGSNCGQQGQPACWPFITGSGFNAKYNGRPVYRFVFAPAGLSTTWCADDGQYSTLNHGGLLYLWECHALTDPNISFQEFVLSGSSWLVSVQPTNQEYAASGLANAPVWLADLGTTVNGAPVDNNHVSSGPWGFQNP